MKAILFGASGMIGQGVLRQCIDSRHVDEVLAVGRTATRAGGKVRDLVVGDLFEVARYADRLNGYDACFFCLGVTGAGIREAEYTRITYRLTLDVAQAVATRSAGATFVYVSGAGTDPSGRAMWARVKGRTELELLTLPLDVYLLRPAFIQPMHGERSRTRWYRLIYALAGPAYPVLRQLAPGSVSSTVLLGQAMLALVRIGATQRVLDSHAINAVAAQVDAAAPDRFPTGEQIMVRLAKAGRVKIAYPAGVLQDDGAHLVVQADWTGQPRDLGLVQFVPGDVFTEHYWRDRWYSVKEVRDTAGARKGWYCDVCRPPVRRRGQVLTDDLDLDLWASADLTTIARLDEEEFAASDVAQRNPVVAGRATAALAELEALARSGFTELG